MHPQTYRELHWWGYISKWYVITNWFERWFASVCDLWPEYTDIADRVEKEITAIFKRQEKYSQNLWKKIKTI